MRILLSLGAVGLAGCSVTMPRVQALPEIPGDSCRVRTWSVSAKGLALPEVPLVLQTEEESDHLAGSLLGDWGRPLASFRVARGDATFDKNWFSGVGLDARELAGIAEVLADPVRLAQSAGTRWSVGAQDSALRLLRDGKLHSLWQRLPDRAMKGQGTSEAWTLDAQLLQQEALPSGSCRGKGATR